MTVLAIACFLLAGVGLGLLGVLALDAAARRLDRSAAVSSLERISPYLPLPPDPRWQMFDGDPAATTSAPSGCLDPHPAQCPNHRERNQP